MQDRLRDRGWELSRRELLTSAIGAGGAMMFFGVAGRKASSQEVDPRVAQVLAKTIGIDMHNHVYPGGTEPHPQWGPGGGPQQNRPGGSGPGGGGFGGPGTGGPPGGGPPRQEESPQGPDLFIAEEIKQSGLTAVCASFVLDFAPNNKPGDARENYLHWLAAIDAELAKGHMRRALNLKDLKSAHAQGRPTIVQTVEGAHFIEGQLERIEEVYKRGLRHLQLLHDRDDMVAPLGDTNTGVAHLGGLTAFGAQVVKECNRLGILVDMAHASHETVLGALKVATKPLIISHTSLDTHTGANPRMFQMMKPRLISKEHAKVVADAGGIVGVWTHIADSLPEFVESIKAMVDAIGIDHVGMGTDTDLLSKRQSTNRAWSGLTGGFFRAVVGEMLHQGFTPEEIGKIGGGNYCRVFEKATVGHA